MTHLIHYVTCFNITAQAFAYVFQRQTAVVTDSPLCLMQFICSIPKLNVKPLLLTPDSRLPAIHVPLFFSYNVSTNNQPCLNYAAFIFGI